MYQHPHNELNHFAQQHHIQGLSTSSLVAVAEGQEDYSVDRAKQFLAFQRLINILCLPADAKVFLIVNKLPKPLAYNRMVINNKYF